MKVDDLLKAMARTVREGPQVSADDPRWLAMARGELTVEELEGFRRLTATSEDTSEAHALLQPLDRATKEKIVEDALKVQRARAKKKGVTGIVRTLMAKPRRWLALPAMAAAVLAILLWARPPGQPLPHYDFGEVSSDGEQMRGTVTSVSDGPLRVRLGRGEHFRIILRPETAARGDVEVRAFRLSDGDVVRWQVPIERNDSGVFRVAGQVDAHMAFAPGDWISVFVIAHAGRSPTDIGEVKRALRQPSTVTDWQLLTQQVHVQSAPASLDAVPLDAVPLDGEPAP